MNLPQQIVLARKHFQVDGLQNLILWMLPSRDARRCDFDDNFSFAPAVVNQDTNLLLCERQESTDIFDMIDDYPPGGNIAPIGSGLGEATNPIYRADASGRGLDAIEFEGDSDVLSDTSFFASPADAAKIHPFHDGLGGGLSIAIKRGASAAPFQEAFGTGGNTTLQAGVSIAVNGVTNTAELLITREVAGTYAVNTIVSPLTSGLVPVGEWVILTLALQTTAPRIRFWIDDTLVISQAPVSAFATTDSATSVTFNPQGLFRGFVGEAIGFGAGNTDRDLQRLRAYMIRRWKA